MSEQWQPQGARISLSLEEYEQLKARLEKLEEMQSNLAKVGSLKFIGDANVAFIQVTSRDREKLGELIMQAVFEKAPNLVDEGIEKVVWLEGNEQPYRIRDLNSGRAVESDSAVRLQQVYEEMINTADSKVVCEFRNEMNDWVQTTWTMMSMLLGL